MNDAEAGEDQGTAGDKLLPDVSHLLLARERLVDMVVLVSLLSPVPGDIVRIRGK